MMSNLPPNILIFTCQWCSYAAADLAGAERGRYPVNTTTQSLFPLPFP